MLRGFGNALFMMLFGIQVCIAGEGCPFLPVTEHFTDDLVLSGLVPRWHVAIVVGSTSMDHLEEGMVHVVRIDVLCRGVDVMNQDSLPRGCIYAPNGFFS